MSQIIEQFRRLYCQSEERKKEVCSYLSHNGSLENLILNPFESSPRVGRIYFLKAQGEQVDDFIGLYTLGKDVKETIDKFLETPKGMYFLLELVGGERCNFKKLNGLKGKVVKIFSDNPMLFGRYLPEKEELSVEAPSGSSSHVMLPPAPRPMLPPAPRPMLPPAPRPMLPPAPRPMLPLKSL